MKKSIIAKNFKKLRLFKSLNQTEFADVFGITRSAVGSYEEGRAEPKLDTLMKVADHFKLQVDDLIRKELTVNQIAGFNYPIDEGINQDKIYEHLKELSQKIDQLQKSVQSLDGSKN